MRSLHRCNGRVLHSQRAHGSAAHSWYTWAVGKPSFSGRKQAERECGQNKLVRPMLIWSVSLTAHLPFLPSSWTRLDFRLRLHSNLWCPAKCQHSGFNFILILLLDPFLLSFPPSFLPSEKYHMCKGLLYITFYFQITVDLQEVENTGSMYPSVVTSYKTIVACVFEGE